MDDMEDKLSLHVKTCSVAPAPWQGLSLVSSLSKKQRWGLISMAAISRAGRERHLHWSILTRERNQCGWGQCSLALLLVINAKQMPPSESLSYQRHISSAASLGFFNLGCGGFQTLQYVLYFILNSLLVGLSGITSVLFNEKLFIPLVPLNLRNKSIFCILLFGNCNRKFICASVLPLLSTQISQLPSPGFGQGCVTSVFFPSCSYNWCLPCSLINSTAGIWYKWWNLMHGWFLAIYVILILICSS